MVYPSLIIRLIKAGAMADDEKKAPRFAYTGSGYWGGAWYPYWTLMIITVLGGFFGLDHFYLRSPTSGALKIFFNIITLGGWWVYDIIQIFKNKERVLDTGLSIPVSGAAGIGAGVFKDKPGTIGEAKSPWRWLGYLLLFFMPLGLDSFVAGDGMGALVKLLGTFIIFWWPLMFLWKLVETYYLFVTPEKIFEKGLYRFFPFNFFMDTWCPTKLSPTDPIPSAGGARFGALGPLGIAVGLATEPIVEAAIAPVTAVSSAVSATAGVVETAANSASALMKATTGTAVPIIATTANIVKQLPAAVDTANQVVNKVTDNLNKKLTPDALTALAKDRGLNIRSPEPSAPIGYHYNNPEPSAPIGNQRGGALIEQGNLDTVSNAGLLLVVSLLIGGGLYYGGLRLKEFIKQRSNNNADTSRDDRPYEPHGL